MPTLGDHFAAAVRAERARRRLTQAQLAERIGWSVSTLADLEAGRRRVGLDDVPKVCAALDVPMSELVRSADPAELRALGL
jgi:transcriptional regulator with XRE-family HTH domain